MSEIGCLRPACGTPSSDGHLHTVRLTAYRDVNLCWVVSNDMFPAASNPPQGGPIRVCGGIATHRPRPRPVWPPQHHLPPAGGQALF